MATLYGVGIGPGDPELLTLKGKRVLEEVDVIAVPKAEIGKESIALDVVSKVVDLKGKGILELLFPMKREGLEAYWEEARRRVMKRLLKGQDVAFITLGDPLFHSTFIHLVDGLEPDGRISIDVVPGVSFVHASTASSLLPLASGEGKVAIVPATCRREDLRKVLEGFETVVLMKVNKAMDKVLSLLEEMGLKERAVFVSRAGWEDEEVIRDLSLLRGREVDYFSSIIVSEVLSPSGAGHLAVSHKRR